MARHLTLILFTLAAIISGCASINLLGPLSRIEKDLYTHTRVDTVTTIEYPNAPGEHGIVYPSTRVIQSKRRLEQYDSSVERSYPNFIRAGVFESMGMLLTSSYDKGIGGGLFGIYLSPEEAFTEQIQPKNALFTGALYRFGIVEYRLRWFDDAPHWSIGTSLVELFQLEADNRRALVGLFPLYVRKRYYLREEIPYVCITGFVGLGFFPSQYMHIGASLDGGSLGGLNLRYYAGTLIGQSVDRVTIVQPYLGMGASVLDFFNHQRELEREWKDHQHSSWNIGAARITPFLLLSGVDTATISSFGLQVQLAPTTVALPLGNYYVSAGVDLFNFVFAFRPRSTGPSSNTAGFGYGVLPVHLSYWFPLGDGSLALEPFAFYSYFPHTMWQVGAHLHADVMENFPVSVTMGHINSSGFQVRRGAIYDIIAGNLLAFDVTYLGISFGIFERIFRPTQLRYFR